MALPAIGQSHLLTEQLDALVKRYSPSSVAIFGCAGGGGFECLLGAGIRRVVGVDINAQYVETARQRYERRMVGLELCIADVQTTQSLFEPVDLIYAALLFEYVDVTRTMTAIRRHCKPNGVLAVLLQEGHERLPRISASPYTSLERLEPAMHLVSPEELQSQALSAGFTPEGSKTIDSPSGKRFSVHAFRAPNNRRRCTMLAQ